MPVVDESGVPLWVRAQERAGSRLGCWGEDKGRQYIDSASPAQKCVRAIGWSPVQARRVLSTAQRRIG